MNISILPSVLDVPREKIQQYIDDISPYVEGISFDIMDGKFVPPTSFTLDEVSGYKVPGIMEVHLMVENPEQYINGYAEIGADIITVHNESEQDSLLDNLDTIHQLGCKTSLALKPKTQAQDVPAEVWQKVDVALIMSVEPGWGGQSFMPEVLEKVKWIRSQYPSMDVNIDGGINADTAPLAIEAGCNYLVSGSYLYKSSDYKQATELLRQHS